MHLRNKSSWAVSVAVYEARKARTLLDVILYFELVDELPRCFMPDTEISLADPVQWPAYLFISRVEDDVRFASRISREEICLQGENVAWRMLADCYADVSFDIIDMTPEPVSPISVYHPHHLELSSPISIVITRDHE